MFVFVLLSFFLKSATAIKILDVITKTTPIIEPIFSGSLRNIIPITRGWNGHYERLNQEYGKMKIGRTHIAKQKFAMCVRPSMQSYLEKLSEDKVVYDQCISI